MPANYHHRQGLSPDPRVRTEPWGQITARLLSPGGLRVAVRCSPTFQGRRTPLRTKGGASYRRDGVPPCGTSGAVRSTSFIVAVAPLLRTLGHVVDRTAFIESARNTPLTEIASALPTSFSLAKVQRLDQQRPLRGGGLTGICNAKCQVKS